MSPYYHLFSRHNRHDCESQSTMTPCVIESRAECCVNDIQNLGELESRQQHASLIIPHNIVTIGELIQPVVA